MIHELKTRDLVRMLRSRYGNIEAIWIDFFRASEYGETIIELEGVLVAKLRNKLICGDTVRARCDFTNIIYNITHPGALVHRALLGHAIIYTRYRYRNLLFLVYVPCKILIANLNNFIVIEGEKDCPITKIVSNMSNIKGD